MLRTQKWWHKKIHFLIFKLRQICFYRLPIKNINKEIHKIKIDINAEKSTICFLWCRTRCGGREEKSLASYLECVSAERWLDSSFEAEGPLYWATLSLCLHSGSKWKVTRLSHLRRLVILAHTRHMCASTGPHKLTSSTPADYSVYKSTLVFFGLIDIIYNQYFKVWIIDIFCLELSCF